MNATVPPPLSRTRPEPGARRIDHSSKYLSQIYPIGRMFWFPPDPPLRPKYIAMIVLESRIVRGRRGYEEQAWIRPATPEELAASVAAKEAEEAAKKAALARCKIGEATDEDRVLLAHRDCGRRVGPRERHPCPKHPGGFSETRRFMPLECRLSEDLGRCIQCELDEYNAS